MLVVQGITNEGKRFRPSAWIDMLVGRYTCTPSTSNTWNRLSAEDSHECRTISKHISVCCCNESGNCEIRCAGELEQVSPAIYNHIKSFAINNNLNFTEGGDLNEE